MFSFKAFDFYWLIMFLFLFFSPQVIFAQEKPSENRELETITVTAQKQEENVQDVPISMSVFNELDIADKKIKSVKDIAPFTPNLMLFDNSGGGSFTPVMRGLKARSSLSTSVGMFIDGIPVLNIKGY